MLLVPHCLEESINTADAEHQHSVDKEHLVTGLFMDWCGCGLQRQIIAVDWWMSSSELFSGRVEWWTTVFIVSWNVPPSKQWNIASVRPFVCMDVFSYIDTSSGRVIDFFCAVVFDLSPCVLRSRCRRHRWQLVEWLFPDCLAKVRWSLISSWWKRCGQSTLSQSSGTVVKQRRASLPTPLAGLSCCWTHYWL